MVAISVDETHLWMRRIRCVSTVGGDWTVEEWAVEVGFGPGIGRDSAAWNLLELEWMCRIDLPETPRQGYLTRLRDEFGVTVTQ